MCVVKWLLCSSAGRSGSRLEVSNVHDSPVNVMRSNNSKKLFYNIVKMYSNVLCLFEANTTQDTD